MRVFFCGMSKGEDAKVCVFPRCYGKERNCSDTSEPSFGVLTSEQWVVVIAMLGVNSDREA